MSHRNLQGLFAFVGEAFHHLIQAAPDLGHAEWFTQIGLPADGPGYDAILRGKVVYDVDLDQVVIGAYGTPHLSNPKYAQVVSAFDLDEDRVVERLLDEPW